MLFISGPALEGVSVLSRCCQQLCKTTPATVTATVVNFSFRKPVFPWLEDVNSIPSGMKLVLLLRIRHHSVPFCWYFPLWVGGWGSFYLWSIKRVFFPGGSRREGYCAWKECLAVSIHAFLSFSLKGTYLGDRSNLPFCGLELLLFFFNKLKSFRIAGYLWVGMLFHFVFLFCAPFLCNDTWGPSLEPGILRLEEVF